VLRRRGCLTRDADAADCRQMQGNSWEQHELRRHNTLACTHRRAMLVSLTVGKVDAGVAVLLTEDKRLVRVPVMAAIHPYSG
jgi:hypothetical protein